MVCASLPRSDLRPSVLLRDCLLPRQPCYSLDEPIVLSAVGASPAVDDWCTCRPSRLLKTYGPPRRQVVWVGWAEQSAKTYPASRANLGPRWRSARAGPPKGDG